MTAYIQHGSAPGPMQTVAAQYRQQGNTRQVKSNGRWLKVRTDSGGRHYVVTAAGKQTVVLP